MNKRIRNKIAQRDRAAVHELLSRAWPSYDPACVDRILALASINGHELDDTRNARILTNEHSAGITRGIGGSA